MAKAMDVANFFINAVSSKPKGSTMDGLRLQKLLFFSQAWYLQEFHVQLFQDDAVAGEFGPVIQSIDELLGKLGQDSVLSIQGEYSDDLLSEDESSMLLGVLTYYDQFTTSALVKMSKDELWAKYREKQEVIPKAEIMEAYSQKTRPFPTFKEVLKQMLTEVGKRDEDGERYTASGRNIIQMIQRIYLDMENGQEKPYH